MRNREALRPVRRDHDTMRGATMLTSGRVRDERRADGARDDDPGEVAALRGPVLVGAAPAEHPVGEALERAGGLGGAGEHVQRGDGDGSVVREAGERLLLVDDPA